MVTGVYDVYIGKLKSTEIGKGIWTTNLETSDTQQVKHLLVIIQNSRSL